MIIPYLNPTYCAHGLFNSHLQTCASNPVARSVNLPSTTIRASTGFKDYPAVIDSAVFPARSTASAPCKVHSIPHISTAPAG